MIRSGRPHVRPACAIIVAILAGSADAQGPSGIDERIARVEQGLLPRAVLKGQSGRRTSIGERMAYHGVPGMSMAVIEDGKLVWARAYGVVVTRQSAPRHD